MSVISIAMIFTTLFNLACYASVVFTVWRITRRMADFNDDEAAKKNQCIKTAKTLVIFVIAYFGQWWAYVFYSFWAFKELPPLWLTLLTATFSNMGGVFNFFAYSSFRKSLVSSGTNSSETNSAPGCTSLASINASMAESNTAIVSTNLQVVD
ncbi:unnamed protein product [Owenia fusiformis]|uniref:G-protein coupled receptors family 1 profile domain-containing protein n=1 Tax=Owenia fusiformis TaxID=6347 RepID=A0A8S4PW98_OWEFU|nr:unnamed protein product [Owenia fusiformis]